MHELSDILENIQFVDRSLWESQRILSLMICQSNVRKKLKLTDVFKLPFDEPGTEDISKEDYKQLSKRSKQLEDILNAQTANASTNAQTD